MRTNNKKLVNLISKDKFEDLEKNINTILGINIQIIDTYGNSITEYSSINQFCEFALRDTFCSTLCKKCKSRGAIEAMQLEKPYIHLCPFDLIEISIPIIVEGELLGSISGGQVALLIPDAAKHLEHLVERRKIEDLLKYDNIEQIYNNTKKLSCINIIQVTRFLESLKNYIIDGMFTKSLKLYETNYNTSNESNSYNRYGIIHEGYDSFFLDDIPEEYLTKNELLVPTFKYIYQNKGESISLSDAANISHISVSYFSRLFVKEMGINFSAFINLLKIKWGKEMLKNTDYSIAKISNELGYNDSAYFVKLFKRYEGITPLKYRNDEVQD